MKKISTILVLISGCFLLQSSVKKTAYSSQPPQGYTGAEGSTCVDCHSSFRLNSGGGSVSVTGLPTSEYEPGKKYDFSLTITHGATDRKRWGFSIKAVTGASASTGSFSSTNDNAKQNGEELSHSDAISSSATNTFTYENLSWTAPSKAGQAINFYFVGNAADNSGDNTGDYIYSGVANVALPLTLKDFTLTTNNDIVKLNWHTTQEINSSFFTIQKSVDGQRFFDLSNVNVKTKEINSAYSYTDANPSYYGRSIFYRLKIVDKDGKFAYSSVASTVLKAKGIQILSVYPNLIASGGTATAKIVADKDEALKILLIDASGKTIQSTTQNITSGNSSVKFNVNTNEKGMVYARFITSTITQTIPLVIK